MKLETIGNYIFAAKIRLDEVDLTGLNNDEVTYKLNQAQDAISTLLDCVDALINKGFNHE
jgi:hypothetical protein